MGFPGGSDAKESIYNEGDLGSIHGIGISPGGGHGNPLQYSCLENSHGQRSLAGCSPWGRKESDTIEWLSIAQTHLLKLIQMRFQTSVYPCKYLFHTWPTWLIFLKVTITSSRQQIYLLPTCSIYILFPKVIPHQRFRSSYSLLDFPGGSVIKNLPANAGDAGSNLGSGRHHWVESVNTLQHSSLENSMNKGAWWVTIHGVTKE